MVSPPSPAEYYVGAVVVHFDASMQLIQVIILNH